MKKSLYDYGDVHAGEIIYIIGSSPSINYLSDSDKEFLKGKITIGVNLSFEGIDNLSYAISAHIANAVYAFECGPPNMPVFVDFGGDKKKQSFSYMKEFFWDNDRIVIFSSDLPQVPLSKKRGDKDISLNGNTSILLLATHLAYIMGAAKIVYIGFEELTKCHFWTGNEELEQKIEKNMRDILTSKKYFNRMFYDENDMLSISHNVHKEFQYVLGDIPGYAGHFHLSQDQSSRRFDDGPWLAPSYINITNFSKYVKFLNDSGIPTHTVSSAGITVVSGCHPTKSVIGS